jgi:hypothetical protein
VKYGISPWKGSLVEVSEAMSDKILEPFNELVKEQHNTEKEPNGDETRESVSNFEVILPIDESEVNQKVMDFAIQTTRNFSGKLVFLYVTDRSNMPSGFLEFAKSEGIRDYEWHYYNSLANDRIGSLAKRAQDVGIDWTGHLHLGGIKSAVKHHNKRKSILILDLSNKSGRIGKSLRRSKPAEISKLGLPVLLI